MAHMVETMAWTGAKPWHGLGVQVADCLTPQEILNAAGLNWEVEKRQAYFLNDAGLPVEMEGSFSLVRLSDGKHLSHVGAGYTPTQNAEGFEFFVDFVNAGGMKMDTAGSLDGGRRVWALASIQQGFTLAGGDRVEGYLLLSLPHRIGESIKVKFTTIRVVCNNTYTLAMSLGGQEFRHRHDSRFVGAKQDEAKRAMGLATNMLNTFAEKAALLSAEPAREADVLRYVYELAGGRVLDAAVENTQDEMAARGGSFLDSVLAETEAERRTKTLKRDDLSRFGRSILDSIIDSPGADLASARGTWWGALNGVTHAVDHKFGRTVDGRLNNAWYGTNALVKERALELAVEYATGAAR